MSSGMQYVIRDLLGGRKKLDRNALREKVLRDFDQTLFDMRVLRECPVEEYTGQWGEHPDHAKPPEYILKDDFDLPDLPVLMALPKKSGGGRTGNETLALMDILDACSGTIGKRDAMRRMRRVKAEQFNAMLAEMESSGLITVTKTRPVKIQKIVIDNIWERA